MKVKVLFITFSPPENHGGVKVVMYRHLIERQPFELLVATNGDYFIEAHDHVYLKLPYTLHRLKKSRFGSRFSSFILNFQNLVWPLLSNKILAKTIESFQPDILLTLADNSLGEMTRRTAKKHNLPLAVLFLDWFPAMDGYYGHPWAKKLLDQRYRQLYRSCDLAFCTSDGMQEVLGSHPNSHIIYPMPGKHQIPDQVFPPPNEKFRLVYVGSIENFYGRMICSLLHKFETESNLEFIVVGPNADWPQSDLEKATKNGTYLGFRPPKKAAEVLAGADALLVVMSFEEQYKLFMRTSFTTKFLDYVNFNKPIILWGPDYCTPSKVAHKYGGAMIVNSSQPEEIVLACKKIQSDPSLRNRLVHEAQTLRTTLFDPDRIQNVFVTQIEKLVCRV
jgi:glycosyltransferase involved in cell wall biosynthesis